MSGESRNIVFKKLSKQSIRNIHERVLNEKSRLEIERVEKEIANQNVPKNKRSKSKRGKANEKEVLVEPNKDFFVGNTLPHRYHNLFPDELHGYPIEEVDPFWKNEYVCSIYHLISDLILTICFSCFNLFQRYAWSLIKTNKFFDSTLKKLCLFLTRLIRLEELLFLY